MFSIFISFIVNTVSSDPDTNSENIPLCFAFCKFNNSFCFYLFYFVIVTLESFIAILYISTFYFLCLPFTK